MFFPSLADVMDFLEHEIHCHSIYLLVARQSCILSPLGHGICDLEYGKYSGACPLYCLTCLSLHDAFLSHASNCIFHTALLCRRDIADNLWTNVPGHTSYNLNNLRLALNLEISLGPCSHYEI